MSQRHPEPSSLASLAPGQAGNILGLDVSPELRDRLNALGLKIGKPVTVIRRGALGGPLHVRVGMTELVLRRKEAQLIAIAPSDLLTA